ncbi:MAG: helix-turn-helix transcriptional regulator [Clostridium lundense]|nr:helix-turn-helix transcriptional regulator [Clostridium lundense]
MIDYIGLEKVLREQGKNLTYIHEKTGLSWDILRKFKKGESVTLTTLEKICLTLDCKIEDIVEIKKDPRK